MDSYTHSNLDDVSRIRENVFDAMMSHVNSYIIEDALRGTARLLEALPQRPLDQNTAFVAYGGGKDSSYIVCFVRLMQLLVFKEQNTTFRLRIVTNRHASMPSAVMHNIDRVYQALGLYADPEVELLLVDGNEIHPFAVDSPLPQYVVERNRLDILTTGHRCQGEARPTFCNACNLSMVNAMGIALSYDGGVDVVMTGDSTRELRAYMAWIRLIATKLELTEQQDKGSFASLLRTLGDISRSYFQDIYGEQWKDEVHIPRFDVGALGRSPIFFPVYRDTAYKAEDHWDLLIKFLGFQFDDLAFSFTESDCANPALMAHLRGLKAEHVYGRAYADGIAEYASFAINLMHKKDFPAHLIAVMENRYATSEAVATMRAKMDQYAKDVFDLSEEQLVCMLYSPFTQKGQNLWLYLSREKTSLLPYLEHIHTILAAEDKHVEEQTMLERQLVDITHLDIRYLRTIYVSDLSLSAGSSTTSIIPLILSRDPHKAVINTLHAPNGPGVSELITGR